MSVPGSEELEGEENDEPSVIHEEDSEIKGKANDDVSLDPGAAGKSSKDFVHIPEGFVLQTKFEELLSSEILFGTNFHNTKICKYINIHWHVQDFGLENTLERRHHRWSGGRPAQGKFSKIYLKFLQKIRKIALF